MSLENSMTNEYNLEIDKAMDLIEKLTENIKKELQSVEEFAVLDNEDINDSILNNALSILEDLEPLIYKYSDSVKHNASIKMDIIEISKIINNIQYVINTKLLEAMD